jgi:hypothetical protein
VTVSEDQVAISNFPVVIGSCLNSGDGEVVLVSGTLHFVTAIRTDADGGIHATAQTNLADMTGVGTISGDIFRVTDTAGGFGGRLTLNFPTANEPPRTVTQSGDVLFISAGSADNLLVRLTFHQTINANGDVTVQDPSIEQVCLG